MAVWHWVELRLSPGGAAVGAGLFLTSSYLLTAHHCVESAETDMVYARLSNGREIAVTIVEPLPDRDFALLKVADDIDVFPRWLRPSTCQENEKWSSRYEHPATRATLHGMVRTIGVDYLSKGGKHIQAMQLEVSELLGNYQGYSGSPVQCAGDDGSDRLIGMLVAQVWEQADVPDEDYVRASNVLHAAMILPAIASFNTVNALEIIAAVPPQRVPANDPLAGPPSSDEDLVSVARRYKREDPDGEVVVTLSYKPSRSAR